MKQITAGRLCERVIEAVGKQWPLDLAGELVGYGGKLIIAGYHQDGPRQVNMQSWNWKGIDVINAHERDLAVACVGCARLWRRSPRAGSIRPRSIPISFRLNKSARR